MKTRGFCGLHGSHWYEVTVIIAEPHLTAELRRLLTLLRIWPEVDTLRMSFCGAPGSCSASLSEDSSRARAPSAKAAILTHSPREKSRALARSAHRNIAPTSGQHEDCRKDSGEHSAHVRSKRSLEKGIKRAQCPLPVIHGRKSQKEHRAHFRSISVLGGDWFNYVVMFYSYILYHK